MDVLALTRDGVRQAVALATEGGEAAEPAQFQINLFWIIVAATTFVLFFFLIREFALAGLQKTLEDRRERIEQGLKDAEQARRDRESAEQERLAALQEARREANEIINRAQKVAAETREQDIAATREELTRMKERATAEIEAEKVRAIAELRGEVADLALAAAGRVVGDSMTADRQRKLVAGLPGRDRHRRLEELMSRPVAAARRYAEAAFQVALAEDGLDRWQQDLALAADILGRPEVVDVVGSPAIPLDRRLAVTDALLKSRISPAALRLVNLLVQRGRASVLPRVSDEYTRQLNTHRGVVMATVTSAVPLTDDETAAIRSRVEAMAGTRVELATQVDPDLIGGLTIQVRDRLLDASIRGRLERLRDQLQAGTRAR